MLMEKKMIKTFACCMSGLLVVTMFPLQRVQATSPFLSAAVADGTRPSKDKAADVLRDPLDTLAFAGVRPGMTVAELYPSGGYFTRMISKIVGPAGHVIGIENAGWDEAVRLDRAMLAKSPIQKYFNELRALRFCV
jgi:predicted methyltransferase